MALPDRHQRVPGRAARAKPRRVPRCDSFAEVPWLQPYPDRAARRGRAERRAARRGAVARETIELAFLAVDPAAAAPPARRADPARRARWSAARRPRCSRPASRRPTARCSGRGRRCRRSCRPAPRGLAAAPSRAPRSASCSRGFIDAHERGDADAALALVARRTSAITMPPHPLASRAATRSRRCSSAPSGRRRGEWRLVPTAPTGMPAAASYLRAPGDDRVPRLQARRAARARTARSPRSRRSRARCLHSSAYPSRSEPGRIPRDGPGPRAAGASCCCSRRPARRRPRPTDVRVMTFNVWLGGDVVDFGKVVEAIRGVRRRHRRAAGGRGQHAADRRGARLAVLERPAARRLALSR